MVPTLPTDVLIDLLFEKSDDFLGIFDLRRKQFVRVNQAGVQMTGYSSEEQLLSDPVRSRSLRVQPLTDTYQNWLIQHVIRGGQHQEIVQINRLDGQPFWGQFTIRAFTQPDPAHVLIRVVDLGQSKEQTAQAVVRAQRVELGRLMEQAPVGVAILVGPDYLIQWANSTMCAMWDHPQVQSLYQPLFTLMPEAAGQGFEELLDRVTGVGEPIVVYERPLLIDRHGQRNTVYWNLVYQPLRELDSRITGVVMIATDATEQVLARQRIEALNDELANANQQLRLTNASLEQKVIDRTHALMNTLDQLEKSKDELTKALVAEQQLGELRSRFVSMASHEFRTPLTVIKTSATLAEKFAGADQQEHRLKYLDRIQASVKHLTDILEEFLLIGKLDEGKTVSHPEAVDVVQLVGDTVADMLGTLKPGQTIQTDVSCPAPAWLDPSLLRKILINLLTNAVKYSGPDSAVRVRATSAGGQFTLVVADQGVGIPPEDQAHLFERFFRANNVANITGTGLGLHLVGRYVGLMGGSVTLQSALNQGTTVTITLPDDHHSVD